MFQEDDLWFEHVLCMSIFWKHDFQYNTEKTLSSFQLNVTRKWSVFSAGINVALSASCSEKMLLIKRKTGPSPPPVSCFFSVPFAFTVIPSASSWHSPADQSDGSTDTWTSSLKTGNSTKFFCLPASLQCFVIATVLVSFPVAVIECPAQNNLKEKGFILSHRSGVQSTMAGKPRQQEHEHLSFYFHREEKSNGRMHSPFYSLLYIAQVLPPREWSSPTEMRSLTPVNYQDNP